MGDTENDACKYLTLDLDSGCLDIEDSDECDAEEACAYTKDIGTYRIALSFRPMTS